MKKLLNLYFRTNTWIIFLVIMIIYFISLTIEFKYIFTDDFYFNSFESTRNYDNIWNFISKERQTEWINYPIAFIVVLIPIILIAFILNIGAILNDFRLKYKILFAITLKSQLIFALNY